MRGTPHRPVHPEVALLAAATLLAAASASAGVFYPKLSEESAACNECHKQ
jgi:hypothetical protein